MLHSPASIPAELEQLNTALNFGDVYRLGTFTFAPHS